jgi:hypothetical protein
MSPGTNKVSILDEAPIFARGSRSRPCCRLFFRRDRLVSAGYTHVGMDPASFGPLPVDGRLAEERTPSFRG